MKKLIDMAIIQAMIADFVFLIQTSWILGCQAFLYYTGVRNALNCTKAFAEKLGGINMFYIKALQSLSTNAHVLNPDQIEYLSQFTDHVPFHPDEIDTTFEESIQEVSATNNWKFEISKTQGMLVPMRAGMVAVVYEGNLNGERVVIKVVRKGAVQRIKEALDRIEFLVRCTSWFPYLRDLNLRDLICENREDMLQQTDFNNEVSNIERMHRHWDKMDYVVVPKVYQEYTNANNSVIVMQWLDGQRMEAIDKKDSDAYSMLLAKYSAKCLLFDRYFHGDLHAGNIFFMKDENGALQLGIIDYGVMGELTKREQNLFYQFFTSVSTTSDYLDVADVMIDAIAEPKTAVDALSNDDRESLRRDLAAITKVAFTQKENMGPEEIYQINRRLRRHGLTLAKSFCRVELALAISDSVCARLGVETTYLTNIQKAVREMFNLELITC